MTTVQPLRVKDDIMDIVEMKSNEEQTSKSAALRDFLYDGVEEYLLKRVAIGQTSIGKAAQVLNKSIYELHETAKEKGIQIGITAEQYENGQEVAEEL